MSPTKKHKESLRWHERLAVKITGFVGSMACALLFTIIACFNLPAAISGGIVTFIPWFAQTFLQLVLLSIIMVGQNLQQRHAEMVAEEDFKTDRKNNRDLLRIESKIDKLLRYDKK